MFAERLMKTLLNMSRWLTPGAAPLIGALELLLLTAPGSAAHAATPAPAQQCDLRLRVELTPDVPDPRDPALLSSLVRGHSRYWLTLQRQNLENASVIVVDLTGPGPEGRCRQVVKAMRADRRVWSVDVQQVAASAAQLPPSTGQPAPDGQLFVYAKTGASYAQQASDRYQCDVSAVDQTGYDPTEDDGGVPPDAAPAKRSDYFRAEAACLEARGYRVR
jgi:hypothetical protein